MPWRLTESTRTRHVSHMRLVAKKLSDDCLAASKKTNAEKIYSSLKGKDLRFLIWLFEALCIQSQSLSL